MFFCLFPAVHCLGKRGQHVHHVGGDAVMRHVEDGCLRIAVDRNDEVAVLHAFHMLRSATDAGGHVELGLHYDARLTDLPGKWQPPLVDHWTRSTHSTTQRSRQILRQGHVVVALDASRSEEHTSELQSLTNLVCR